MLRKKRNLRLETLERRALTASIAEIEPNDRRSDAVPAQVSAVDPLLLTGSANKQDRDFFEVTFTEAGTYQLNSNSAKIKIDVEDARGVKRLETEPRDGLLTGMLKVNAGEKLSVRVRGLDKAAVDYNVALSNTASGGTNVAPLSTSSQQSNDAALLSLMDTSGDDTVSSLDALIVINHLNRGDGSLDDDFVSLDCNDDGNVTSLDALIVINHLNHS